MTKLNCKVGDLAIVVATELPENLGQIVEVLGLPTGVPLFLSGCGHMWQVRAISGRATLNYRIDEAVIRFVHYAEGPAPDRCLRPVSGLTDEDGAGKNMGKRRPTTRRKREQVVLAEAGT